MAQTTDRTDDIVKLLIEEGTRRGYLTYQEMNKLLEGQFIPPDKMDQVFMALEDAGVDVVDESDAEENGSFNNNAAPKAEKSLEERAAEALDSPLERVVTPEKIDDPVRMYLTQMGEIPLLTREEEISPRAKDRAHPQAASARKCSSSGVWPRQRDRDPRRT